MQRHRPLLLLLNIAGGKGTAVSASGVRQCSVRGTASFISLSHFSVGGGGEKNSRNTQVPCFTCICLKAESHSQFTLAVLKQLLCQGKVADRSLSTSQRQSCSERRNYLGVKHSTSRAKEPPSLAEKDVGKKNQPNRPQHGYPVSQQH